MCTVSKRYIENNIKTIELDPVYVFLGDVFKNAVSIAEKYGDDDTEFIFILNGVWIAF